MDNESQTSETPDLRMHAIAFKPVAFIPHDPEVWFAALELQFEARRITSQRTRFTYALEAIPGDQIAAVRDLVLNPPSTNPYDELKKSVLHQFLPSREERLRKLLARHPLGDAKPSRHLAHLRALAGPSTSNSDIVQELWLESLPVHVQSAVTAVVEDTSLDKAAAIADKIIARVGNTNTCFVATTSHSSARVDLDGPLHVDRISATRSPFERLSFKDRVVVPTPTAIRHRSISRRPTHPQQRRHPSVSRPVQSQAETREGWCWFHRTYGPAARRCRKPCTHPAGNSQASE